MSKQIDLEAAAQAAASGEQAPKPEKVPAPKQPAALAMLEAQQDELASALPPGVSIDRFIRITRTMLQRDPDLMELGQTPVGQKSLISAIHRCAQMGLEPNSDLGHCYLLPFRKRSGELYLQFILGYKGILAMARKSGQLKRLDVHEVYENDDFEFSYGIDGVLKHRPKIDGERGKIVCYYGYAEFQDGGYYYTVMTLNDIDERKRRSASVASGRRSPWDTDPIAMSKKTVIRAMAPHLPLEAEAIEAVETDDGVFEADGSVSFVDVGVVEHKPDRTGDPVLEASASESAK